MQSSPVLSLPSPSFNSYSSSNLADIAARVVEEFRRESQSSEFDDEFIFENDEKSNDVAEEQPQIEGDEEEEDDDDFQFPTVYREPPTPISADEIFYNGQIRPVFPIFGRDLLFSGVGNGFGKVNCSEPGNTTAVRVSLGKLMREDRDPPSCSSSEADDLDGVPAETYCVWKPKSAAEAEEEEESARCKKSSSTGSSKRWRFRDLLHRSNSDGRDSFVFLASSKKKNEKPAERETTAAEKSDVNKVAGKMKLKVIGGGGEVVPVTAAQEGHFARSGVAAAGAGAGAKVDGDRRRSFLPYRQDLVGFFANVNGVSRNLHPF